MDNNNNSMDVPMDVVHEAPAVLEPPPSEGDAPRTPSTVHRLLEKQAHYKRRLMELMDTMEELRLSPSDLLLSEAEDELKVVTSALDAIAKALPTLRFYSPSAAAAATPSAPAPPAAAAAGPHEPSCMSPMSQLTTNFGPLRMEPDTTGPPEFSGRYRKDKDLSVADFRRSVQTCAGHLGPFTAERKKNPEGFWDKLSSISTINRLTMQEVCGVLHTALLDVDADRAWADGIAGRHYDTMEALKHDFMIRFQDSNWKVDKLADLLNIKQGPSEDLNSYLDRFTVAMTKCGVDMAHEHEADITIRDVASAVLRKGLHSTTLQNHVHLRESSERFANTKELMQFIRSYKQPPSLPGQPGAARIVSGSTRGQQSKHSSPNMTLYYCSHHGNNGTHATDACLHLNSRNKRASDGEHKSSVHSSASAQGQRHCDKRPRFGTKPNKECYKCHGAWFPGHSCTGDRTQLRTIVGAKEFNTPAQLKDELRLLHVEEALWRQHPTEHEPSPDEIQGLESLLQHDAEPSLGVDNTDELSEPCQQLQLRAITYTPAPAVPMEQTPSIYMPIVVNDHKVLALVDSGAVKSFISPRFCSLIGATAIKRGGVIQLAAEGVSIPRVGVTAPVSIAAKGRATFQHSFEIATLEGGMSCLVGLDLFKALDISIGNLPADFPASIENESVKDRDSSNSLGDLENPFNKESTTASYPYSEEFKAALSHVLAANEAIPKGSFCNMQDAIVFLDTGNHPGLIKRQYPIPHSIQPHVTEQVEKWLDEGIIKKAPYTTKWNSPLIAVAKKDADGNRTKVRVVLDPRHINELIPSVNFPLPLIREVLEALSGAKYFTTLDLRMSFNQFPLYEPHQQVTAFTWKGTQYVFVGCPFGLKHISAVVQRTMSKLFDGHGVYVVVFIDDIIIFSKTLENHLVHVSRVIELLNNANLRMNTEKSHFAQQSVQVLGHVISAEGVRVDKRKLCDIPHWDRPKSGKNIEQDLGFFNYFREFIPNYAKLTSPIEKLRKHPNLSEVWTEEHDRIYHTIREVLSSDLVLSFPDFNKEFKIATDASNYGVGAVLYQETEESNGATKAHYISFASTALNSGQKNYSATKKELLAIVFALKRFRYYVWGKHFTLYTDHRALMYLFTVEHTSAMLNSWIETLLDFDFTIVHKPGILNVLPDYLSRLYTPDAYQLSDEQMTIRRLRVNKVDEPSNDWKLNERVFLKLDQLWGPHTVDAFATPANTQLPTFFTFETDAFSQDWSQHNCWIHPPWHLIGMIIDKVIQDGAMATVITPYWVDKPWVKKLKQLSVAHPLYLPHSKDLFLHKRSGNSTDTGMPHWKATVAWRIAGRYDPERTGRFCRPDLAPKHLAEIDFSQGLLMAVREVKGAQSASELKESSTPPASTAGSSPVSMTSGQVVEDLMRLHPDTAPKVPASKEERATLLQRAHLHGHFGATAMHKSLQHSGVEWPGMIKDCLDECLTCTECQRFTIAKHGYHPITPIRAELPFDHVAIDLAGPFTESERSKHSYLLVVVDVCTRFTFLRTLPDKTAESVADQLFRIFSDVGFPKVIQSDNGKEFVNKITQALCAASNIDHRLITPYHPRANGLAERNVQTAKSVIFKHLKGREQDWELYVPQAQYFMNTKVAAYHNSTPYSLMFGRTHNAFTDFSEIQLTKLTEEQLVQRIEFLTNIVYPSIANKTKLSALKMSAITDAIAAKSFPPGAFVMALDELRTSKAQPRYLGPFKVVRRNRGGAYLLQDSSGNIIKRSPEALKSALTNDFGNSLEVEKILDHRGSRSEREYLVKWKGYDESMNSWEPYKNFDATHAINLYWKLSLCSKRRK